MATTNCNSCEKEKVDPFLTPCVDELEVFDEKKLDPCFGWKGLVIHAICALKRIAAAVEALLTTPAPVHTGLLHLRISDWATISNGACIDIELLTSSFEHQILGFGVSYVPPAFSAAFGAYAFQPSDILNITPWDFTSGVAIGNPLGLSTSVKVANQHDSGAVVAELHIGHVLGVKLCLDADPGDTMNDFPIDFFVYVKPEELNPVP